MQTSSQKTIELEEKYSIPFFNKTPISIDRGAGVYVWDEENHRYIDFTSGWGVTSIGHANPVITQALTQQAGKIIQNPNSGLTHSPARAKLQELIIPLLPQGVNKIFFTNSGAEANDASIKLARKISGKKTIISAINSFHGRTLSTIAATGQKIHRDKFNPMITHHIYVPFNDLKAIQDSINTDIAAIILEPIQGEGGVYSPDFDYLKEVSKICRENQIFLIMDEVQTGFGRTGKLFASDTEDVQVDFLTMAKGIAGGFPFGGFAVTDAVASRIETGDHGGTYCGNPLGCAVAHAVISYIINNKICDHVNEISKFTKAQLKKWQQQYPEQIVNIRGQGLLLLIEFNNSDLVNKIDHYCLENGLIINAKHGSMIRIFPALNISEKEMLEGLEIIKKAIDLFI